MSSAQASGRSVKDKLELQQLYHDSIKQSGDVDVDVKVTSDDPDQEDMLRMGKRSDLKRIFRQSSMIAFTCIVQATWQVFLVANTQGLLNGGHAGLFWSYVWTALGMSLVVASLAEMASMAPTSGGQYHWVSEFSPPQFQRFLSYMAGWMATLSWHTTAAGATFVVGTLIQGVIVAYRPSFKPEGWQGTLFVVAVTIMVGIINIVFAERLPQIQKFMAILFGLGWIPVVVVLIVLAPHPDASVVFTQFSSTGGWMPLGLSVMVGQISTVYCLISFDAAAHMSEEVKKASLSVPRAMMWSYTANACVGFVVVFAYLYSIPSIEDALDSPTGFPFLYVFQQATYHGTIPLVILVLIIATAGCTGCNASASRQTFAFARDDGLPFRSWISKVHLGSLIPRNAIILTCSTTILLSLINIGSTVAFNAIISLQLIALMSTYSTSIGCVLYQRIWGGNNLPPAQWSLGSAGKYINAVAFVYTLYLLFWIAWPVSRDVVPENFNWAPVLFASVFVISLVFYYTEGRKVYRGPVTLVQG